MKFKTEMAKGGKIETGDIYIYIYITQRSMAFTLV